MLIGEVERVDDLGVGPGLSASCRLGLDGEWPRALQLGSGYEASSCQRSLSLSLRLHWQVPSSRAQLSLN